MRTLFEIIEGAKDGNMPKHEECYWAMLALDALRSLSKMELLSISQAAAGKKPSLAMRCESGFTEAFRREKLAFDKDPKQWVGPSNDPSNPDYQKFRDTAFMIAEKATGVNLR